MVNDMAQEQQQQKTFAPPVSVDEMFPTEHIKCADLRGQPRTFTIAQVVKQEVEGEKGKKVRGVVKFRETDQSLVMNRTNAILLMAMFGANPQDWAGKRVQLNPDRTQMGRETVDCIRVGGSPDIDRDIKASVKLPKRSATTVVLRCTKLFAPSIADYERCDDLTAYEGLEVRRAQYWKRVPTNDKAPLKAAADACRDRLAREEQVRSEQQESALTSMLGTDGGSDALVEFDAEQSLQDLKAPASRDALESTWSAVVDHFEALGAEIPLDYEAAYQLSKESFAE